MKKLLISMLFLLCASTLFAAISAQDIAFVQAHGITADVDLSGSFIQTKGISNSPRSFKSFGNVIISPEHGIAWLTEKPYKFVLVVTDDHLTQKIRDNKPTHLAVVDNPVYTSIASSLQCVFFGDFEMIQKVFDAECNIEGNSWSINLCPKAKELAAFISSITIKGTDSIESLKLLESNGDSILYEFENLVPTELSLEENSIWTI